MKTVQPRILPLEDQGVQAVIDLSLRAWAPVFESLERVSGSAGGRRRLGRGKGAGVGR